MPPRTMLGILLVGAVYIPNDGYESTIHASVLYVSLNGAVDHGDFGVVVFGI